jgi:hypothetical protein
MKKGIFVTLAVAAFAAIVTTGCGTKYTPMSPEQVTAAADSTYNAQLEAKTQELSAACNAEAKAAEILTQKQAEYTAEAGTASK